MVIHFLNIKETGNRISWILFGTANAKRFRESKRNLGTNKKKVRYVMQVIVDQKAKTLTVVMDLETPHPSNSGKTKLVACTYGPQRSQAQVDGKNVTINLNAYISAV